MRTILLGSMLAALSLPALAADVVTEMPPEPVATEMVTTFDWTGAYVGLQAGGVWVDGEFKVPGARTSEDFDGGTVGKFVGYNVMFDQVMVGIEGDVSYNWNQNTYRAGGVKGRIGTDWSGSLRARAGYAFDRALIFATGGWAATNGYVKALGDREDRTFNGWTIGAGVDYAVTDSVFVRAEYRFTDYSDRNIQGVNVDLDEHRATLGVGFKF
jgi:outer membrane immunogenic protein